MIHDIPAQINHVYVRQDGTRWAWAIHRPHDCDTTSTDTYDTQWDAAQMAARIAAVKGLPLRLAGLTWHVADEEIERLHQIDMEVDEAQGEGMSYTYGPAWA